MENDRNDILGDRWATTLVYGVPATAIIISGGFNMPPSSRAIIWALALLVMSAGCLVNALRCGRVHCYFTAPFLFLMAIASAVYGALGAQLGTRGWNALAIIILVGTAAFYYVPERLMDHYRGR